MLPPNAAEGYTMEQFKMLVSLAVAYDSGCESHWRFSADMAANFVERALSCLDLTLPIDMSVRQKIELARAIA